MMAHHHPDGSDGGHFPSATTLEALRVAVAAYAAGETDDEPVCDALELLAREAHERKLRAEDMLLAFKRVWNELPPPENRSRRERMFDRVVRICIDTYYRR